MSYDESLASRVREILSSVAGFSEKKMFGGLCFLIGLAPAALRSGGDLFTRLLKGGRGCGGISSNGWGKKEGFRWARIASPPSPGKFAHDYFQEGTLFSHSWSGRSGEENLT